MTLCLDEMLILIEIFGAHFLLGRLTDHGEEERKRHDLALEKLQRTRDEQNNRKAQRVKKRVKKIEKELMSIAWHPSRWWDWCMPEDEKKRDRKIMGVATDSRFKNYLIC